MEGFDQAVINAFLKNQRQLFPEDVAATEEEAEFFLEDVCAIVCDDRTEALEYMKDNLDVSEMSDDEILGCEEVFVVGDGRYLIVEG